MYSITWNKSVPISRVIRIKKSRMSYFTYSWFNCTEHLWIPRIFQHILSYIAIDQAELKHVSPGSYLHVDLVLCHLAIAVIASWNNSFRVFGKNVMTNPKKCFPCVLFKYIWIVFNKENKNDRNYHLQQFFVLYNL